MGTIPSNQAMTKMTMTLMTQKNLNDPYDVENSAWYGEGIHHQSFWFLSSFFQNDHDPVIFSNYKWLFWNQHGQIGGVK